MAYPSSSSSGPARCWKYDVFLNFRGEDTRKIFISHLYKALIFIGHLYKALVQNSINIFIDAADLRKGNDLSHLLTAISDSRLSIVVFSQNYASSAWCLKELVQILDCMDRHKQRVVPIFYEVDPSDVRKLNGKFAEAFSKHEHDSNTNMVENLSELHLDWTIIKQDSAIFKNLTELEDRRNLEKFPQFSGIAIKELPSSIFNLTGLVTLTLRYSKTFRSLTSGICQLKSLNYLSLSGCTRFKVFPEILEDMKQLVSLDLDETSIRELPPSIERLQGLVSLNLKNCKRLVSLPDSICSLLSLEWLNISGCSTLSKLPEDLWYLKRLDVEGAGIRKYNNHGPAGSRPNRRFFRTLGELAQFRSSASSSDLVDSSYDKREAVSVREWVLALIDYLQYRLTPPFWTLTINTSPIGVCVEVKSCLGPRWIQPMNKERSIHKLENSSKVQVGGRV
ncbi:hypothetical protein DVH24_022635 [Malus domestica]|uniref:TIR domain-containing protein n=1 Tax=Malus domestica TaxID=3750 RepID=A0A498KMW0_MALDO|nr:hypothetical protein DVH24_022635 [Malus domestica]